MVFIAAWNEFVEKSLQLYCAQPSNTRYSLKYLPGENEIVLKVTDDKQALQYRTNHSNELRLIEQWNQIMFKLTTTKNPDAAKIQAEIEEETRAEREEAAKKKANKGGARKPGKQ